MTGVWRSGLTSTAAVAEAFNHAVPVAGGWVVAFCTFLFGYTTLIGWSYYGEVCLEYILGPRVDRALPMGLLRAHRARAPSSKVDLVWAWGDLMNGLQVFPNLVGVVGPRPASWRGSCGRTRREPAGRTPEGRTRLSGFERVGGRAPVRRGVARGRGARARDAALRLQPGRDRGGLPGLRDGLRAGAAPHLLRGEGQRQRGDPAPARLARGGGRHRLGRGAARRAARRLPARSGSSSPGWARRTRRSPSGSSTGSASGTRRARTRSRGSAPRRRPARTRWPASRCASTPTSTRARTPTSRPASARRSSASTSASPPRSCGGPASGPGWRSWACSATSARRSPTSSRWPRPRAPSPT